MNTLNIYDVEAWLNNSYQTYFCRPTRLHQFQIFVCCCVALMSMYIGKVFFVKLLTLRLVC